MAEFLLILDKEQKLEQLSSIVLEKDEMVFSAPGILMKQSQAVKFKKDSAFFKQSSFHFSFQGVILNSDELKKKYSVISLEQLLYSSLKKRGEEFFDEYEGSYAGTVINLESNDIWIYSDALGNHPVYYYNDPHFLIISNKISNIVNQMKQLNIRLEINEVGAYSMLTYGYMYAENTLFKDVKKMTPGNYLRLEKNHLYEKCFYSFPERKEPMMEETKIIKTINNLFCEGVELQLKKNKEYGYVNLAPLSGGLDSRITVYALKELGAENLITYTYSETDQMDESIPKAISKDIKCKWIFKSLDNGLDLMNIEEAIRLSDSRCYYPWAAQLNDFVSYLDRDMLGIVHTGVLGDVVIGSFCHDFNKIGATYKIGDGAYSDIFIEKLKDKIGSPRSYHNYVEGMFFNRAYNGAALGYSTTFQEYTEALSPFMYRKLFDFCLSLPEEMRYQHNLYYKWVKKYYPEAAQYTHNGLKIHDSSFKFRIKNKDIFIDTIPSRLKLEMNAKVKKRYGMNPMQYWYETNEELRIRMNQYFDEHKEVLKNHEELYKDVNFLYSNYGAIEKLLCISLVGSLAQLMTE